MWASPLSSPTGTGYDNWHLCCLWHVLVSMTAVMWCVHEWWLHCWGVTDIVDTQQVRRRAGKSRGSGGIWLRATECLVRLVCLVAFLSFCHVETNGELVQTPPPTHAHTHTPTCQLQSLHKTTTMGKTEKSRQTTSAASGQGLNNVIHTKGTNFYRDAKKVRQVNMLKGGKPTRNKDGKIIKEAEFQSRLKSGTMARVQGERRLFENTRTIGQKALEGFREAMSAKANDPYAFIMRQNKLPMSLLTDSLKVSRSPQCGWLFS